MLACGSVQHLWFWGVVVPYTACSLHGALLLPPCCVLVLCLTLCLQSTWCSTVTTLLCACACRVPFYYEMKILFVLWLLSPATKGASILYRKFLHPQLAKREKVLSAVCLLSIHLCCRVKKSFTHTKNRSQVSVVTISIICSFSY